MTGHGTDLSIFAADIALIGCGKMGSALLQGWLAQGLKSTVYVLKPHDPANAFSKFRNVSFFQRAQDLLQLKPSVGVIVLAVKPQIMGDVCHSILPLTNNSRTLVLSIAAGQTIESFKRRFGFDCPVVRAMPNTPAAIGKGMTVAAASREVTDAQKKLAGQLLKISGLFEWVQDENLLDAVTAVSGSGPAYVFYLIEALAAAGEAAGLDKSLATTLARQTVIGSAALAEHNPSEAAEQLRRNVTSPGGTTEAALKILMDGKFQDIMNRAIDAAVKRSRELQ